MKKLFLISLLSALAMQSSYASAPTAVTVQAPAVTVTAGSTPGAATTSGSIRSKLKNRRGRRSQSHSSSNGPSAPVAAAGASSSDPGPVSNAVSSSSSSSNSGPAPSGGLISKDEFIKAFTSAKPYFSDPNVPMPTDDQFNAFISNATKAGGITTRTELAMFLAEILWESGGLVYRAEVACKENNCAGSYQDNAGLPGKFYFGRGYIQLTWGANYKKASADLYGDDRLLQNPDQVATNEEYAWGVSFWFWKTIVKPKLNGTYNFGLATSAINGALECQGGHQDVARKRYKIYVELLKVLEPSATPVETGCYN